MQRNVGPRERYLRFGIGALSLLGSRYLPRQSMGRKALGVLGLGTIASGAAQFCAVNQMLGINRYKNRSKSGQIESDSSEPRQNQSQTFSEEFSTPSYGMSESRH